MTTCAKCKQELKLTEMKRDFYLGKGRVEYLCNNCTCVMSGILRDWIDGAQITITWPSPTGDGANTDSNGSWR